MSVLRRLRRGSKDTIPAVPVTKGRQDIVATLPSTPMASKPDKLTFFDLPAEVRNEIYECLAADIILYLPTPEERKKRMSIPVAGLLLASRQCRREYLPLLYSTVPVVVDIRDFDFRDLMRVIGGLYSTELKAFRANDNMVVRLRTHNCTRANMDELRRWLLHRGDSLDRLPWRYEVALADPNGRIGCFRQSRENIFYAERLQRMGRRLEDTLQWELQAIIGAFEKKGVELADVLQGVPKRLDPTRQAIRGLPSGGLR